ncbi:MAG: hypothetical protein IT317_09990 [Anaerolineales bacterium]|nr:hypothetical protein [Anaerolineales bacterium]
MDPLAEGTRITYQLSPEDAENLNSYIAAHPEQHAPGAHAQPGQRVPASVVMSLGPKRAGPPRLAVRLDGADTPEHSYHVAAAELVYAAGAWYKPEK